MGQETSKTDEVSSKNSHNVTYVSYVSVPNCERTSLPSGEVEHSRADCHKQTLQGTNKQQCAPISDQHCPRSCRAWAPSCISPPRGPTLQTSPHALLDPGGLR